MAIKQVSQTGIWLRHDKWRSRRSIAVGQKKKGASAPRLLIHPDQGAKETAHGRRPPFTRGASSSTAFIEFKNPHRFRLVVWMKQNRLNSSFVLSMWLGSHRFDPDQNSIWIEKLAQHWASGRCYSEHGRAINNSRVLSRLSNCLHNSAFRPMAFFFEGLVSSGDGNQARSDCVPPIVIRGLWR
jgi:hypothetical protein